MRYKDIDELEEGEGVMRHRTQQVLPDEQRDGYQSEDLQLRVHTLDLPGAENSPRGFGWFKSKTSRQKCMRHFQSAKPKDSSGPPEAYLSQSVPMCFEHP